MEFKVTRIYKLNGEGPVRAICDISINDEFLVKGFRVIEGKNGLFVGMPRNSGKDGQWYSTAMPLSNETRQKLDEAIFSAFEE